MSEHRASIRWRRQSADFTYESYNRGHDWRFDSGIEVPASSSPEYLGDPDRIDPEEAFVAALSSCHMLTFLALAARKRLVVESYDDEAVGFMEKNDEGRIAITRVVLRPRIRFAGDSPASDVIARLHERAHEHCFIANSVRTQVRIEGVEAGH